MNKKILIIGLSFNDSFGGGVTLRNLFSQLNSEQIGITDYCVTNEDLRYSKKIFNINSDSELTEFSDKNEITVKTKNLWAEKIKHSVLKFGLLSLRKHLAFYYNNFLHTAISPNHSKFISEFNPDFIYVVPYNRKIIDLALKIKTLYNIPIVTHFMDDYRKRSPKDIFYYLNEFLTKQQIKTLVSQSHQCLAICDYMSEEYQGIFKRNFHSFHNPIEISKFQHYKIQNSNNIPDLLKIAYTGTIAENNCDTLIQFSGICEKLSAGAKKVYFDIYSSPNESNIFYQRFIKSIQGFSYTTFRGKINHSEIIPTLYRYNLLLLPLSFKQKYFSVIEFSFPTKVAEYMASGIPTLYIIPKYIALHHYVTKHKIGYLIDQLDSSLIEDFLLRFINETVMWSEDSKAREIAYANFDITQVAGKFEKIFS